MTFAEDDRDKGRVITGSSNLSQSGLQDTLEFNVELKNRADYQFALAKFNELWAVAVDVSKPYEDTIINRSGAAARVRANLLDLLTVAKDSVVLPLPSFSLKVVEDYVGFERKEAEYGGQWAMATFIEATETGDEVQRKQLMDKIIAYNREDLEATWAVFEWLRSKKIG